MARIRSIKPEFWSDAKIKELSHGAKAFFIGLWNFCDDQGRCTTNPKQLSLWMPCFRSQDVELWLRALISRGLVKTSSKGEHLLVVGWKHQKIDKPRAGDPKLDEIQWLDVADSPKPRDLSPKPRDLSAQGSDSIDGIGEDLRTKGKPKKTVPEIPTPESTQITASPDQAALVPVEDPKISKAIAKKKAEEFLKRQTAIFINQWAVAYKARYRIRPPLGDPEVGEIKNFVRGCESFEEALEMIQVYPQMNNPWFVKKGHDFTSFVKNQTLVRNALLNGIEVEDMEKQRQSDMRFANLRPVEDLATEVDEYSEGLI